MDTNIPPGIWIATAIGTIAGLHSTGGLVSTCIRGALWFGNAFGVAYPTDPDRVRSGSHRSYEGRA